MKKSIILKTIAAVMLMSASWSPAATLIHRYDFNSNLTDSVGSVNGAATSNNTYTEAPSYVTASPTGAVGISSAIYVGQNPGTKISGFSLGSTAVDQSAGSISLWLNAQAASTGDYIIRKPDTASGSELYLYTNSTTGVLTAKVGTSASIVSSSSLTVGSWTHVAMTWDSTNGVSFYVNGSLVGTQTLSGFNSTAGLRFGNYDLGNVNTYLSNQYSGYIYDVQSYSGALSGTEVSYLYNNPGLSAVPEPGSMALLGLGGVGLALLSSWKRFSASKDSR